DAVESEARRLEQAFLDEIGWSAETAPARKLAGVDLVRTWWEGAERQWDFGGMRWMRVLFLETQFARYWGNLLRFDLGYSNVHKVPVMTLVMERMKYSLTLALSSLVLAYLIAVPLGILSAKIHNSPAERGISVSVFALYSLPSFFVATLLVRLLAQGQPGSLELIPDGSSSPSMRGACRPSRRWAMSSGTS
ncbi:MAG: ABC transporter permease, partial [Planctomycetes bacterium]|nr:ABC transporter permease [Planctomycetota bacterium]